MLDPTPIELDYFRLIGRVEALDLAGGRIVCRSALPERSTILSGHFPGFPILPGVLLTEAMAQASGWLMVASENFQRMPFLAGVKQAKFRGFVKPLAEMRIEAAIEHRGSGFAVTNATVAVEGKTVADAQIMLRVMPFPNAALRAEIERLADKVGLPRPAGDLAEMAT